MLIALRLLLAAVLLPPAHDASAVQTSVLQTSAVQTPAANRFVTGATYLAVGEVALAAPDAVRLALRWDAAWRDAENWDAAWVFVKTRTPDGTWRHAPLAPEGHALLANRSSDAAAPAFTVSEDGAGAFVYRATPGEGDNDWTLRLALAEALAPDAEVRVFGLEMVYVPEGPFEIGESSPGDGNASGDGGRSFNAFYTYEGPSNAGAAYRITSEDALPIGPRDGALYYNNLVINFPKNDGTTGSLASYTGDRTGRLAASFPKGFAAMYAMKYELTQGQYADFLSHLAPKQARRRAIHTERDGGVPYADHRGTIRPTDRPTDRGFVADRPYRAAHGLSYLDGLAFADWAGLRPISELEWEKAARGPESSVRRGYPWGTTEAANVYRFLAPDGTLAAEENGTERVDGNALFNLHTYPNARRYCGTGTIRNPDLCRDFAGGDGGKGPVRVGIFGVGSGGDRAAAGASYYGLMEMGGNVQEPVLGIGSPGTRRFAGTHGDGRLTPDGDATNADWSAAGEWFSLAKGGWWGNANQHMRTSDRFHTVRDPARRSVGRGFRGARSVR